MRKAFKYRLFTNTNQERELAIMLESHRRLYNDMLAMRIASWECDRVALTENFQSRCFTWMRKTNPFFARINSTSASRTIARLHNTYNNFFRRVARGSVKAGFPRFKGRDHFRSIEFRYDDGIRMKSDGLHVMHVGKMRIKMHRPYLGVVKTARLRLDAGRWFVIFACELPDAIVACSENLPVGIDVGLKSFVTTSDGESLGDSRSLERALPELRRKQRALRRCKRGSKRRKVVKLRVARTHYKVREVRRDMHHKVARSLVNRYGTIAAESLNILGMVKNRWLSRRISDAAWGSFIAILTCKAENAGGKVILVDAKNTSQQCSNCGEIVRKSLAVRVHKCECGCVLDRDHNAAKNILARAAPSGANVDHKIVRSPKSRILKEKV